MAAKGLLVQGVYWDGLLLLNGVVAVSDVVRPLQDVMDVGAVDDGGETPECGLCVETSGVCLEGRWGDLWREGGEKKRSRGSPWRPGRGLPQAWKRAQSRLLWLIEESPVACVIKFRQADRVR